MIGLYQTIKGDLFDIARRLKEVDKDYFVVYSYRDHRYEVHNRGNKGNTFCFSAPSLDERVVIRARRTRRERIAQLMREIEAGNENYMKNALHQTAKNIEMGAEKVLSKGGL
ncbi:MAG: hypothetical protein J1F36_03210 [Clostridiales bacterium]|nr:hypothetical protein [Clostridiales bacterium]